MPTFRRTPFLPLCAAALLFAAACDSPSDPSQREQRLLYSRVQDGSLDIFSLRLDGTGEVRLTSERSAEMCPRWSPDRSRIAYVSNRDSVRVGDQWARPGAVYVMRADGSSPVRVTTPVGNYATDCPDWTADGKRLAYSRYSPPTDRFSVFVIRPDGSGDTELTEGSGADFMPRWSPDGGTLAFLTNRAGWSEIILADTDGGNLRSVPDPCPANVLNYAWSPDGTRFAVECDGSFGSEVHTMRIDGSHPVRISAPTGPDAWGYDTSPVWGPDGTRLAISRMMDIYTVGAAGEAPARVTSLPGFEAPSDWR